jgi:hypothetical protein
MVTQPFDRVCFEAYARLLARPDPPDLPRRAVIVRYEGDPDRRATPLPWEAGGVVAMARLDAIGRRARTSLNPSTMSR